MKQKEFIEKIKKPAIDNYKEYNILPSLTISQAICESGWGESSLASKYNNLFGMKWTKGCGFDFVELLTSEFVNGKYIKVKAKFRRYDSWADSIKDHTQLLLKPRYKRVIEALDYLEATTQIKDCGYATSSTYTQTLRAIIETHKLYVFDWWKSPDELLTKNFKWGEFWSNSKSEIKIEPPTELFGNIITMANDLQVVRDLLNKPIKIVSGYRTKEWNKYVDGAENSYHMKGIAVDIKVSGISSCRLAVYIARHTYFNGFGIYTTWLHVDLRDKFTIYRG